LTDGEINQVIVLEITPELIKYKDFDNPSGPSFSVYKSEVEKIIFQNGKERIFAEAASRNRINSQSDNQQKNEYRHTGDNRSSSRRNRYPIQTNDAPSKVEPPKFPQVRFGLKGGVNLSTFSEMDKTFDLINESTGKKYENANKIAFHAGFLCQINLHENLFFLQPELLVSLQGDKGTKEENGEKSSFADDLYYLQLPVHLVYKATISPACDILLGAGIYGAYGIYGSKGTFDGCYSRLDYGVSFMGGFQFGKIQLTGAYELGKNGIIDTKRWNETKDIDGIPSLCTRNLKIALGYFF
jgi:hypothetical protein